MKSCGYKFLDKLIVWISDEKPYSNAEWTPYAAELRRYVSSGAKAHILVLTDGGAPNAAQRQLTTDLLDRIRTAVVSQSRLARGAVTVFSWFNADMRAFSPLDIVEAFRFLGITERAELESIWHEVTILGREILDGRVGAFRDASAAIHKN
jgi:hypothetical protein